MMALLSVIVCVIVCDCVCDCVIVIVHVCIIICVTLCVIIVYMSSCVYCVYIIFHRLSILVLVSGGAGVLVGVGCCRSFTAHRNKKKKNHFIIRPLNHTDPYNTQNAIISHTQ